MSKSPEAKQAQALRDRGFDGSYVDTDDDGDKYVRLKCSQCQALAINGIATHEQGCPNSR